MTTTRQRAVRKQVPLYADDLAALQALKMQGSDKSVALHSLTGIALGERPSEAEVLHALVVAGRQALAEKEIELSYRRAAEVDAVDQERLAWQRGIGHRRLAPFMESRGDAA